MIRCSDNSRLPQFRADTTNFRSSFLNTAMLMGQGCDGSYQNVIPSGVIVMEYRYRSPPQIRRSLCNIVKVSHISVASIVK
ncbi:hypothetical protein EYC80_005922 [Monilinia laxa]|uniref:Uncharacterized protein n=1 Tax=Monilinia laxa TaxID=61186 RepID=A0A5N6KFJ9_MONLA|nr:hypothetical protein EYC80_005922 [Monilinia laxa]